ncbi:hypothetical protein [Nocardioides flavescens]|uniref:Ig-like domain (Group 3) n=1 Tax=Nocardioides flavescens TaxID=2691959 RepID=A0A6L7EZJ5_9ACTN|nr:hypothetical protein [Nocardioides flavescens]MXG91198.1 hypothetical protein [Nocardioides flavescens]
MRTPQKFASLTALAVGAASLSLVAAPAANAAPPAGADLAGIAQLNGTAVAGLAVTAYDVEVNGTLQELGTAFTDAAGEYYFDFDGGTASNGGVLLTGAVQDRPQVKVYAYDARTLTGDTLRGQGEYYNDADTEAKATAITLGAAGSVTTVPTISLALSAGIKGTVSVPVPAGYVYTGSVTAYDADDVQVTRTFFDNDPATTGRGAEVTYLLDDLDPNESYTLRYFASAQPAAGGPVVNYISKFYKTGSTFAEATPVETGAAGAITQPIDIALTNTLQASKAPELEGQAAPGKTLSVDPGTWTVRAGTEYTYQWLINDAQVATTPTYTLSKADLGKTVRAVVTARNGDFVGSASTDAVKVGLVSKLKKVKAKKAVVGKKTVLRITGIVKVKGVKKAKALKLAKGKVFVYEDDVKVGKGRVVRGKLLVNLKGVVAGTHEYTVVYKGNKKVAAQTVEVKAKA